MIGALMRLPWEAVASRMLRALHANGFDDIDAPQLSVLLWPGPEGLRPSELATRTRMTKQALNYLLGNLQRLGYLERWGLTTPELAAHLIRFLTEPTSRSYIITYPAGRELCRAYVAGAPERFRTLLAEQVRVSDLLPSVRPPV